MSYKALETCSIVYSKILVLFEETIKNAFRDFELFLLFSAVKTLLLIAGIDKNGKEQG
jgi:hypothetical protein